MLERWQCGLASIPAGEASHPRPGCPVTSPNGSRLLSGQGFLCPGYGSRPVVLPSHFLPRPLPGFVARVDLFPDPPPPSLRGWTSFLTLHHPDTHFVEELLHVPLD